MLKFIALLLGFVFVAALPLLVSAVGHHGHVGCPEFPGQPTECDKMNKEREEKPITKTLQVKDANIAILDDGPVITFEFFNEALNLTAPIGKVSIVLSDTGSLGNVVLKVKYRRMVSIVALGLSNTEVLDATVYIKHNRTHKFWQDKFNEAKRLFREYRDLEVVPKIK